MPNWIDAHTDEQTKSMKAKRWLVVVSWYDAARAGPTAPLHFMARTSAAKRRLAASTEAAALRTLYEATGGARWVNNSGWLEGAPCAGEGELYWSAWVDVRCNGTMVVVLNLEDGGGTEVYSYDDSTAARMAGTLPSELGLLSGLEKLIVVADAVSGTLPSQLGG